LGRGDGTFQSQTKFEVGQRPFSVAVADLNRDGPPDLVTANYDSHSVSVLLGASDGTFQAPTTFAVGENPHSVAVGDLNGDGVPDLVTANYRSNNVSVLLGRGDGTFQPQITFAVGWWPSSVAVADLNRDGVPDLVTANSGTPDISVLLGRGDGTFQPHTTFEVGQRPFSVAVADLNRDELPDLITANFDSNSVSVLLGTGDGTFQPHTTFEVGQRPYSVAVADLNRDELPDLITANSDSNNVSVLLNAGDGTFQAQTTFEVGQRPFSVAVADLNRDELPDLITVNFDSNSVSVLLNAGDGTFQAQTTFVVGNNPHSVAAGDLNGDGVLDLFTANSASNNVSVLLGRGAPVTRCTLTGDEGDTGWFVGPVMATLKATASIGQVERIEYRFGEDETWQVYDVPLMVEEGVTTLQFRAIDDEGRAEPEQTEQIHIDTVPPVTTAELAGTTSSGGCFMHPLVVSLSASDPEPGSSAKFIEYRFDDEDWQTYLGPFTISKEGISMLHYRSTDVAGNIEGANSQVICIHPVPVAGYPVPCSSGPIDPPLGGVDLLLIRVDFPDLPGDPVSESDGQSVFAAAGQFMEQSSWGQFWFENVDVTPTYRMAEVSSYYADREGSGLCELTNEALAAASHLFTLDDYWSYAISFAGIGYCWDGLGHVNGTGIWLQGHGMKPRTVARELGHNIGMWRSTSWDVDDGNPLSPNGSWSNDGDPFDVMGHGNLGNSPAHFSTIWKERAGWMDLERNVITSPDYGGYRVYAHDFGDGTFFVSDRTYAIRIPTGDWDEPSYWLEYRQSLADEPHEAGIQVRLTSPWREYLGDDPELPDADTLLLDMSGRATSATDLPLAFGETFFEPNLELVITYVGAGIGPDGNWWAEVQFGLPGWQNPRNYFDVNADGVVSAYDVLLIINDINRDGSRQLPPRGSADRGLPFFDVNGDAKLTPEDVLDVIIAINRGAVAGLVSDQTSEGEAVSAEAAGHGGWWMFASADTVSSAAGANSFSTPWSSDRNGDGAVEWAHGTRHDSAVRPNFLWREQEAVRTHSPLSQLRGRTADQDSVHLSPALPAWETLLEHRLVDEAVLDAYFATLA
jgi:hypothetical protein